MSSAHPGILAVWNDRDPAIAAFYEDWYVNQHLPERVGLPGWRAGRRYERAEGSDGEQFFTWYELDEPACANSPEYLRRLDTPTPETRRVMAGWRNMTRTVCRRASAAGPLAGAHVLVARFGQRVATAELEAAAAGFPALAHQVWQAAADIRGPDSAEQAIRGEPDGRIASALVLDFMRAGEASACEDAAAARLRRLSEAPVHLGRYVLLCDYR